MKRIKRLLLLLPLLAILFTSCGKVCRCYRYDGEVDEFDIDELEVSCESLELQDYGTTYSLCERTL